MSKCPGVLQQLMEMIGVEGDLNALQAGNAPLYEQICQHQLMPIGDPNIMKSLDDIIKDFHAHLDECAQCRDNPMGLCSIGATLLQRVSHPTVPE